MATLNRSACRFLIALGLVTAVLTTSLTGSTSAFTTREAPQTTAMVGYLKLDSIQGESTSRTTGSGNELVGDVDVAFDN